MDDEVISQSGAPAVGTPISPAEAMRLAIREGARGKGYVSPNPLVGCTIVDREHRFLSVGYHSKVGLDHAEIDALKKLPDASKIAGAHVYVTLEPCAHQGRTPSCARTLAPLKPASVSYAVEDPNPLVAGKGAAILREAGVSAGLFTGRADVPENERIELTADAEELAEIFLHFHRAKEPFVAVKIASSLDGKMAFVSGESKWITGEKAREHVQLVRAEYDAVAIGRNTFVADDPSLNVRHSMFPGFKNKVVVFDPTGQTLEALPQSKLLSVRDPQSVIVVAGAGSAQSNPAGARLVEVALNDGGFFRIGELLQALKSEGLTSVLIEGGAYTIGSFMSEGKVERLHTYIAPSLLGGKHGVAWSAHFGSESMAQKIRLERSRRQILGEDLYWTARVRF